jgi:site-specific DNA-methyltransferase (adenine-specific)
MNSLRPYYQDEYVTIYHGDCREALTLIPDNSVDLVFTDPPYLATSLDSYDILAEITSLKLKDGCFLYAYCGTEFIPQGIQSLLATGLEWFWMFNIKHTSGMQAMWGKRLLVGSKQVLVFTKGKAELSKLDWCWTDFVKDNKAKESGHKWEQGINFALQQIAYRTAPNDLVLDPYMGSGTFLFAAKQRQRRAVGFEIEERYCEMAAKRCSQGVLDLVTENGRRCYVCGTPLNGRRADSGYCSNRCRQKAYRQRLLQVSVTGKAVPV